MKIYSFSVLLFYAVLITGLSGCVDPASNHSGGSRISEDIQQVSNDSVLKEMAKDLSVEKANEVKTEIRFPVGELKVTMDSRRLLDGNFQYYLNKWVPDVSYDEEKQTGRLQIITTGHDFQQNFGNLDQSDWNIRLNRNVRNDLTIHCIAGEGHIDLEDGNLERLDFSMTAGEMEINLRNSSVPNFTFKALAGNAVIDLSGRWENDLHASLQGGVGEMTLKLPACTGIRLEVHGLLGDVDASGLQKEGQYYTNTYYGKTAETLYIDFTGGIGSLEVDLVD